MKVPEVGLVGPLAKKIGNLKHELVETQKAYAAAVVDSYSAFGPIQIGDLVRQDGRLMKISRVEAEEYPSYTGHSVRLYAYKQLKDGSFGTKQDFRVWERTVVKVEPQ